MSEEKLYEILMEATRGLRCSLGWSGLDTNLELAKAYIDEDMFDMGKDLVEGSKEGIQGARAELGKDISKSKVFRE